MPRRPVITLPALTLRLQVQGPQTAAELAAAAGVHRSQVSRTLADTADAVVQIGAARRARYALRRRVRNIGDRWPVFRVDDAGRAHEWARLEAFHGGFRVEWAGAAPAWCSLLEVADVDGWVEGFPFFLGDLRPQGFLGRAIARRVTDTLRLPSDPTNWGDDDTLVFLQSEGDDLPGDLVVGDVPLRRTLARQMGQWDVIEERFREMMYPEHARQSMESGMPGSSAGGEQPKFLTHVRVAEDTRAVLVKFSQPLDTPAGRRWADLLVAEAHALDVLVNADEAVAGAQIIDAGGRRFLEVRRFDRVGAHGRLGVVSLAALHGAFVGSGGASTWVQAAESFAAAGLLAPEALTSVRRRQAFGELIGNSDMHFGNLAFWLRDELPLHLAPVYDMLPMLWAPVAGGEIVPRTFAPLPPTPAQAADWAVAAGWAEVFWQRVAADERVSPEFAVIARESGATMALLRARFSP
jgi:HipA-like C-terminal domain